MLWAIQHTTRGGSTWLDHTTVRTTRRGAWREFNERSEGATPAWHAEVKRRRRAGTLRAVKVRLAEV